MKTLRNLVRPRLKSPVADLVGRFLQVFESHGVDLSQVPRLIPQIKYEDLLSECRLIAALTPAAIDATAALFGVRRQWLEGLDDLMLQPFSSQRDPMGVLTRLAAVFTGGPSGEHASDSFPLRVLTTSMSLDRSSGRQSLLAVIVRAIADSDDNPAYCCQVCGDAYDWTDTQSRIELKAITWLILRRLKTTVPMFQVSHDEFESIRSGMAIPSIVWRKGLITEPSLEDFVQSTEESVVAKEAYELPAVLNYLDAQGLRDFTFHTPAAAASPSQEPAPPDTPTATTEPPVQQKPPGKRDAQKAQWTAIKGAAQAIWSKDPEITIAAMIQHLRMMPNLKANSLGESAIHKHIRDVAPPEVRGKPGRKPNKSA